MASWLAIKQREPFGLTPLAQAPVDTRGDAANGCTIVLNVDHPMIANLVVLAGREPELAAYVVVKLGALRRGLDHAFDVELARKGLEARWTRLQP